jgi:protein-S-isoprenylcysteine O-methyltransferase Ste14
MSKRLFGYLIFIAASSVLIALAGGGLFFLRHPLGITYLVLWVAWWLVRLVGMRRGVPSAYDQKQRPMVRLSGATVIPLLILVPPWEYARVAGPIPRNGPLAWVGLIVFAAGILLQFLALQALHGLYTTRLGVQPGHRLVTSGPYRVVRHPGYLSQIMCMTGIGLAMSSLIGLGLVVLVLPLFSYRMREEEAMLLAEFGEEYLSYMQRTKWRLLPLVH